MLNRTTTTNTLATTTTTTATTITNAIYTNLTTPKTPKTSTTSTTPTTPTTAATAAKIAAQGTTSTTISSLRVAALWCKASIARSRRRRRRGCAQYTVYNAVTPTASNSPTCDATPDPASYPTSSANSPLVYRALAFGHALAQVLSLSSSGSRFCVYLALLVLSATCSLCAASPCDSHSWWDPVRDQCIPCTVCQGEMIPLRPCQLHRDTICGSIYDLKIDWVVLAKTEPNWKERRKSDNYSLEPQLTHEQLQQLHEETIPLDWQTAALFLAVLACLLFFIVAAGILIHHMRQWRRMERRLDQDVEELSTKLMAKLAEVQSLEGGTFFIGNADALRIPTTFQPQHVLLPAEKPAKHHERRILKTLQPGNVYIEESSSKG